MPFATFPKADDAGGDYARLGDYVGSDLILRPISRDTIPTQQSPETDVIRAEAYVYANGKLTELGEVMIFWSKVIAQLAPLVGSGEAVAAKLTRPGRAYELVAIEGAQAEAMDAALTELDSF